MTYDEVDNIAESLVQSLDLDCLDDCIPDILNAIISATYEKLTENGKDISAENFSKNLFRLIDKVNGKYWY